MEAEGPTALTRRRLRIGTKPATVEILVQFEASERSRRTGFDESLLAAELAPPGQILRM